MTLIIPFQLEGARIWRQLAVSCNMFGTRSLIIDVEQLPKDIVHRAMASFRQLGEKYAWILHTLRLEEDFIVIGDPHKCDYYMQWILDDPASATPAIQSCVYSVVDHKSQDRPESKALIYLD
jgi:hypothetical protein